MNDPRAIPTEPGVAGAVASHSGRPAPPVAGIGGSVSGLDALVALLRATPADAPLALVAVVHADAELRGDLAELLARHSPMPTCRATDGQPVHAGTVYVCPPGHDVRLVAGHLAVGPHDASQHPPRPVDALFVSLAGALGPAASGVVLAGPGDDGARGVIALRRAGAGTFALDTPAAHGGMPAAAFETGCVDVTLPPERIALRLAASAHGVAGDSDDDDGAVRDAASLEEVFPQLRRVSGIDFSAYKPSTLRRRIQRRAALGRHATIRAYLTSLHDDPAEVGALAEDMLIHVTRFFRDPAVFETLARQVLPRLLAEKAPGESVRVWVPGCSTGEEVYSLVIALIEQVSETGLTAPIKVFGTDLSDLAIESARAGRYPASIEDDVSRERLARFFLRTEAGYVVRKEIRERCVFARHDLTRDPPFSHLDLLSCRNLMIYLASSTQRRVLPALHYALRPGGVLVLGASESPGVFPGFEPLDAGQRIYVRTGGATRVEVPSMDQPRWPSTLSAPRALPPAGTQSEVQREADRAILAAHAPPGVVVSDDLCVVQFRGPTGPFLEPVPGAASLDILKLAREELRVDLRAAIERARQTHQRAEQRGTPFRVGDTLRRVDIEVLPLLAPALAERHFVVLFHERPLAPQAPMPAEADAGPGQRRIEDGLRVELASTRAYLHSVIEQFEAGNEELRAANEEILSSNEELQSTNEEFQTAQEELQSSNEELSLVNAEVVERNRDARRVNDDLSNVLSSSGLAILILDRASRIRRFTPEAARHLSLIPTDVGRPVSDIQPWIQATDLAATVREVFARLTPHTETVTDPMGRWYQLSVGPYLTSDARVDGAVVTIVDVDALQRGRALLAEARDFAERIVDTIREPLVVLDENGRIRAANRAFCETFSVTRPLLEGLPFEQLDKPRWLVPAAREALTRLARGESIDDVRLEVPGLPLGDRSLVLTGRPLARGTLPTWYLLTFDDITEQLKGDALVRRSEKALREMLAAASESILIARDDGTITFANAMASDTFGYAPRELVGASLDLLVPDARRRTATGDDAPDADAPPPPTNARGLAPSIELTAHRKDGSTFPAEIAFSTMEGEHGMLSVAFLSDITARKANDERIRSYKRSLQEMAFDAALAEERQRRRIAEGLHDHVGQALALAQHRIAAARAASRDGVGADLDEALRLVGAAVDDIRTLTFELSPPVLYDLGLPSALGWLGEQLAAQHNLSLEVSSAPGLARVDDETASLLFRAIRELLLNVAKHARTPRAAVSLGTRDGTITVVVEDDGVGFDPALLHVGHATRRFGLFSVREQILRLGGAFDLASSPGAGTTATLRVPLARTHALPPSRPPDSRAARPRLASTSTTGRPS